MGKENGPYHTPKENRHLHYLGNKRCSPAGYRDLPDVSADRRTCRLAGRGRKSCFDLQRPWVSSTPGHFNPASTKQLQLHCGEFQHATPIPWTPITDRAKHRRTNKEKIVVTLVKHQRNERRTVIPHSKLRTGECIEKKRETWTHSYTSMPING